MNYNNIKAFSRMLYENQFETVEEIAHIIYELRDEEEVIVDSIDEETEIAMRKVIDEINRLLN